MWRQRREVIRKCLEAAARNDIKKQKAPKFDLDGMSVELHISS